MQKKNSSKPFAKTIGLSFLAHALVIGSALYFSLTSFTPKAANEENPYANVVMVDLAAFAAPEPAASPAQSEAAPQMPSFEPEPQVQPEPEPPTPPVIEKPAPVAPKPKMRPPKPKEKIIKKMKPEMKPDHHRRKPFHHDEKPHRRPPVDKAMAHANATSAAANSNLASTTSRSPSAGPNNAPARPAAQGKPKPISRNAIMYPRQAQRMNVEDELVVKYDVNDQGQVENIRIVKAAYAKLFERDVIKTMKKWRYEKRAAKDLQVTIVFSLTQGTKIKG